MKKNVLIIFITFFCTALFTNVKAQRGIRIGYIDMDYILENVPDYTQANAELASKVQKWKVEIETELKQVEELRKELNNEKVLLTKELIEEREEDIAFKEKEILEYQQKRFGPKGDLFIQKSRLVQPIQDQVFVAVQEVAQNGKYDFIFDKASDLVMLYSADKHDVSDKILLRINRASKRKQVNERKKQREIEREEKLSTDNEKVTTDREQAIIEKQDERAKLLEKRKAERDSIRAAKKKEFEERRAKLLELQQRRKDSIQALRDQINRPQELPTPGKEEDEGEGE